MYLVFIHQFLYLRNLGIHPYPLRLTRHDIANGMAEELLLPLLHSATNITIGNDAFYLSTFQSYAQAQLAFADKDNGIAELHIG